MKPTVAPVTTYGTLDSDVTVESSQTIRVFWISFWNGTGVPQKFQLQYAIGSGTYADVAVPTNQTYVYEVHFLADFGLKIPSVGSSDASVSVFHSHGGS